MRYDAVAVHDVTFAASSEAEAAHAADTDAHDNAVISYGVNDGTSMSSHKLYRN